MWEYELAEKMKESTVKAQEHAVSEASAFVGVLESINPIKISISEGEIFYEADDITMTSIFYNKRNSAKTGDKVLIVPINTIDHVAVIDIVKE